MDDEYYEEGTRSPRIQGGFMSYWPELLIESYHLLLETSEEARKRGDFRTEVKLFTQAEKIKKRMKSLGYYDCWEKDNGLEVVVP